MDVKGLCQRFKHKNYFPVIILINGAPYFFPNSWVEEEFQLGSAVQYASKKDDPLLILPTERSISLSIEIPMDQIFHKSYYNICKQAIKAATLLCVTTKSYRKDNEIKGSQKIALFDSLSYKFPIKKGKAEGFQQAEIGMKTPETPDISKKAEIINQVSENSTATAQGSKPKVDFSNITLPYWLPIACGYFGASVQSLGCILTSFSTKSDTATSKEIWSIGLVEYEWRNHEEEDQTAEEIEETEVEAAPEKDVEIDVKKRTESESEQFTQGDRAAKEATEKKEHDLVIAKGEEDRKNLETEGSKKIAEAAEKAVKIDLQKARAKELGIPYTPNNPKLMDPTDIANNHLSGESIYDSITRPITQPPRF